MVAVDNIPIRKLIGINVMAQYVTRIIEWNKIKILVTLAQI